MRRQKKHTLILPAIMILAAAIIIAVMPTEAEGAIYDDTLRLHILANSDSDEDQKLKLELRDAILSRFSDELSDLNDKDEAEMLLKKLLPEIEDFSKKKIFELGYNYNVTAMIGTEWYDTRDYGNISLPKGNYTSLKIVIGEGGGKNWWCVMFPPLCLDVATESAPKDDGIKKYSDEEFVLVSKNGYNAKFKLLEIISDLFGH